MSDPRVGVVVLAGGSASRAQEVLEGRFKAELPVTQRGENLLGLLIRNAARHGVPVWVVAEAAKLPRLMRSVGANAPTARWLPDVGGGTASALLTVASEAMAGRIVVVNCDTLVPGQVLELLSTPNDCPAVQLLAPVSNQNMGLVGVDLLAKRVVHWGESDGTAPSRSLTALSSTGAYSLDLSMLIARAKGCSSLEHEVIPDLVARGDLCAKVITSTLPVIDFGTNERYRDLVVRNDMRKSLLKCMFAKDRSGGPSSIGSLQMMRSA